jgi:exodeoxyribonuclease VII large subunit
MSEQEPYSVADFVEVLNSSLRQLHCSIVGEVTELKVSAKGHVYFSIKDKEQDASLPCKMWSSKYAYSGVKLENGMEILIKGRPDFYAPFGQFSFTADELELVGEGALKKAYDKLKLQLEKEGVFAEDKKRAIPDFVKTIGVVTSSKGAVIHDFSNNLGKNGFDIKIMHTNVEGQGSGKDILMSLRAFKKEDIDVLVMIRGGGSMQSLSGFDNELLVREIANYPVPVLAGVGHHQDIPLAALASDLTASTPSIVAVKLNESWDSARLEVKESERTILESFTSVVDAIGDTVSNAQTLATDMLDNFFQTYHEVQTNIESHILVLQSRVRDKSKQISQLLQPVLAQIERQVRVHKEQTMILPTLSRKIQRNLNEFKAEIARYQKSSLRIYEVGVSNYSKDLADVEKIIKSNNPERQLSLGYSIARSGNKIIRKATDARQGDDIDVQVSDGTIKTKVK